jgi:hypothetical protein
MSAFDKDQPTLLEPITGNQAFTLMDKAQGPFSFVSADPGYEGNSFTVEFRRVPRRPPEIAPAGLRAALMDLSEPA